MVHAGFLTCIPFIAIISIVSGYSYDSATLQQPRFRVPDPPFSHQSHRQYPHSHTMKRMTMDENVRTRESWGQMGSQPQFYHQSPFQRQQPPYYQNQNTPTPLGNNGYFSTTQANNGEAVISIYKAMNKGQEEGQRQGQGRRQEQGRRQGQEQEQEQGQGQGQVQMPPPLGEKGSQAIIDVRQRKDAPVNVPKKVKVLICKLQGQA